MNDPKQILFFDLETDGLEPTVIHCICTIDGEGEQRRYSHEAGTLRNGLDALSKAKVLVGHNIIAYDLQALFACHPEFETDAELKAMLPPKVRDLMRWHPSIFTRVFRFAHPATDSLP